MINKVIRLQRLFFTIKLRWFDPLLICFLVMYLSSAISVVPSILCLWGGYSVHFRLNFDAYCFATFFFLLFIHLKLCQTCQNERKKTRDLLQEREGTSLNYFNFFLTISNKFLGLSWSKSVYLGISQSILVFPCLPWTTLDYLRLSQTSLDYLRLSRTITDYL